MRKSQKCLFGLSAADLAEILRGLEKEWPELKKRRLFISGGTGFFGKWLLAALAYAEAELALDLHVTVLSRDPARFLARHPDAADFHFIRGDVADFTPGVERYDFILHAATDTVAITSPAQEEERARVIVDGTRRILDLARASGARLLQISSGGVYGAAAAKLSGAREEDRAIPLTAYGRAKLEAEQSCLASGQDFVIARAFAFLGPYLPLDAHYAAGNFLRDAQAGGPIVVRGDGTALRSYLYPTDLVTWLLRLLLRGASARAYNVGSDEVVSTAELARRIAAACPPAPEVVVRSALPQGPQNIYLPDIRRARDELGLDVQVKLDETIRRSLAFLRMA
jgi:nucleoside-diphosphate-sugar epimerase